MTGTVRLFLCGDVMTGRGIDQALPHPGSARLYEPCVKDASGYVNLAERAGGPLPRPLDFAYIWGDVLEVFEREQPAAKIINLETAITRSDTPWRDKDVHYKMSPQNVATLTAAGIDCCALANNHIMDWGLTGLLETLDTLEAANIKHAGAGRNLLQAQAPAILETGDNGRVVVFSIGSITSGIPVEWSALAGHPGLHVLESLPGDPVGALARIVGAFKEQNDIVVVSVHWGGNWGYTIPSAQTTIARRLIDEAGVDIVHGHSSHHVKAIEVYRERLVLYGCGDFFNDYEGIAGHEKFRGDLGLMYFADVNGASGKLQGLRMVATQVKRFQLHRASPADARWLESLLNREGEPFNTQVRREDDDTLTLCRR